MYKLEGMVGIVTGGSRGIGASIVRLFAASGARVYFTYTSSVSQAESLVSSLRGSAGHAVGMQSDASSFQDAEQLVQQVIAAEGRIDVVVNNAGITRDNLMLRMTEDQWDQVITTNLKSAFNLTKQVLKPMLKQRAGSIINLSSVVGLFGNAGQANYAASKAGLIGFSKSIAKEVGSRGIRCNVIAPGYIETEMTGALDAAVKEAFLQNIPMKRMGTAEEVAQLALFLASRSSEYLTGQVISLCGGLHM